jgi:hypothetical protein
MKRYKKNLRLKNAAKRYASKKASEMSAKTAGQLEKHDFESPESQNHRQQDIIKRKSSTTANKTDDQKLTAKNTQKISTTNQGHLRFC